MGFFGKKRRGITSPPAGDNAGAAPTPAAYAAQGAALSLAFEAMGKDIFVASCSEMHLADGRVITYCVWGAGVHALLPRTDLVVFMASPDAEKVQAPWDRVIEVVGQRMKEMGTSPPRWEVTEFPDADELTRLTG